MKLSSLPVLLGLASQTAAKWHEGKGMEIKYSPVGGYFLQDDVNTNPSGFDYVRYKPPMAGCGCSQSSLYYTAASTIQLTLKLSP
jgi:hypothetical protein